MAWARLLAVAFLGVAARGRELRCEGSGVEGKRLTKALCTQVDKETVHIRVARRPSVRRLGVHVLEGLAGLAVDVLAAEPRADDMEGGEQIDLDFSNTAQEEEVWIYWMRTPEEVGSEIASMPSDYRHTEGTFYGSIFQLTTKRRTPVADASQQCGSQCASDTGSPGQGVASQAVKKRKASIAMRDGASIDARIYEPPAPAAAIVFAHGGMFSRGDCEWNRVMALTLSSALNSVVVDSTHRQGKAHPHPAATLDLEDVTRALRDMHPGLPVGVAGSSSGGYFALALAQHPPDELPYAFSVALAPVAHPGKRRDYLRHCINGTAAEAGYAVQKSAADAEFMLQMQTDYWVTDAAADAADAALGPGKHGTPTLAVLGGQDESCPEQVNRGLHDWVDRIIVLESHGHDLCRRVPANEDSYLPELTRFVGDAVKRAAR